MSCAKRKKIVYLITGLSVGGAEQLLLNTVKTLDKRRFEPVVVKMLGADQTAVSKTDDLSPAFEMVGVKVINLAMKNKLDFKVIGRLSRVLRTEMPDILHTHLLHADILGRIVGKWRKVPRIVSTIHAVEPLRRHFIFNLLDRWTSRWADLLIATSEDVQKEVVALEKLPSEKIRVIRNTVLLEDSFPESNRFEKRKMLGIAKEEVELIGILGRLKDDHKGHSVLFKALSQLESSKKSYHLVVIGDGPDRTYLEKLVTELHLKDSVTFLGMRSDVGAWLHALDIFVLPSHWEGFPLAVIEAMAARKPIVTTPVGGNREMLEHGKSCLFVKPGDVKGLSAALTQVLEDDKLAIRIARQARLNFEKDFDMRRRIHEIQAFYEKLFVTKYRPLKYLVFVTTFDKGGVTAHLEHLVKYLPKREFDVEVASGHASFQVDRMKKLRVPHYFIPIVKKVSPLQDLFSLFALVRLIKNRRYDIVHTHMAKADWVGGLAAKICKVPFIVSTAHGATTITEKPSLKQTLFDLLERYTYRRLMHRVISVSGSTTKHLIHKGAVEPEKVLTVTNGIDLGEINGKSVIHDLDEKKKIREVKRRELGIRPSQRVIISVGRLAYPKSMEILIESIKILRSKFPDLVCLIVGEGAERESLEKMIKKNYLEPSVDLLGDRSDVNELLIASDVFVLSSYSEGMPISVLESMVAGVPAVVSNVGGVSELIQDRVTGLLSVPGSVLSLTGLLSELLEKPVLRASMATVAKEQVRLKYDAKLKIAQTAFELTRAYRYETRPKGAFNPTGELLRSFKEFREGKSFWQIITRFAQLVVSPLYHKECLWFFSCSLRVPMAKIQPRLKCVIRQAEVGDARLLSEMLGHEQLAVERMLESETHLCIVAEYKGRIVGVQWALVGPRAAFEVQPFKLFVKLNEQEGYLYDLRVEREYRSQGIMPALQFKTAELLAQRGVITFYTDILEKNVLAISGVEKIGCKKLERVTFTKWFGHTKVKCVRLGDSRPEPFSILYVGRNREDLMSLSQWKTFLDHSATKVRHVQSASLFKLVRLLSKKRVDVLHCEGVKNTLIACFAAWLSRYQGAVTVSLLKSKFETHLKRIRLLKFCRKKIDAIFIPNSVQIDGEDWTKEVSIHHCHRLKDDVEDSLLESVYSTVKAKEELGMNPKHPVVGAVMPLSDVQMIWSFLRICRDVKKEAPECQFLVVGDGPLYMVLKMYVNEFGLKRSIRIKRNVSATRDFLKAMDIVVSLNSASSGVVTMLEAIALKKPVVRFNEVTRVAKDILDLLHDPEAKQLALIEAQKKVGEGFVQRYVAGEYLKSWSTVAANKLRPYKHDHWRAKNASSTFS